jgi:amino acid transporter
VVIFILLSIIIGEIHSLNSTSNDTRLMNNTNVLFNNNTKEQRNLRASGGFGVYIGGSIGGVVGLIILLVIIYFFCFRGRGRC